MTAESPEIVPPCVFCAIAAGEAPATVVDDQLGTIAVVPLNPVTNGHVIVLPRRHVVDFTQDPGVTAMVCAAAADLAARLGGSYNLITSKGVEATQSVFHLHVHLVPRHEGDGLPLPWTPQQAAASSTTAVQP